MYRCFLGALVVLAVALPAAADVKPFHPSFIRRRSRPTARPSMSGSVATGPRVVLLHGFGDTGDMWGPLAAALVPDHTVVVPDLRGMGLSSHPDSGYDKKTQGVDIARVLDSLKIQKADLVTHDIGNMVGVRLRRAISCTRDRWASSMRPCRASAIGTTSFAARCCGTSISGGPDVERLVAGRERIYLDRFYNELSANPHAIDEATRNHYAALYARPHAMHDAFEQFKAFSQDATDNKAFLAKGKLSLPVLAIGAEKSFGTAMADDVRFVATNVTGLVIPNSGHWLMEEQAAATVAAVRAFLDK